MVNERGSSGAFLPTLSSTLATFGSQDGMLSLKAVYSTTTDADGLSKLRPFSLHTKAATLPLTPPALYRRFAIPTATTTAVPPAGAAVAEPKQSPVHPDGPGSSPGSRAASGHAGDALMVYGGPGTVQYDKPPLTEKYSALWEYETYRKLPINPHFKHKEYANYLHAHKYPWLHVDPTPWPIFQSWMLASVLFGITLYTHFAQPDLLIAGLLGTFYGFGMWWRDITREGLLEGKHTIPVKSNMRFAFALFIVSEVMFFFTMFWGYYHNNSCPVWIVMPPEMMIKGWGVPLLNTFILLSSGAAVTWAHHATICAKEIMKKAPK